MSNQNVLITGEELRSHFVGELPLGQSRDWQPEGAKFLYIEENDKGGEAESHRDIEDVFDGIEGEARFEVGGELDNPRTKSDGELRASAIKGGIIYILKPGDTLRVPRGTPHRRIPNGRIFFKVSKMS